MARRVKAKGLIFDRLGDPIGRESKTIEFINYADQTRTGTASVFGRSCGRVDFIFPVWVGRMTADDADRLADALKQAAADARSSTKIDI